MRSCLSIALTLCMSLTLAGGCGGPGGEGISDEGKWNQKIEVEAYLFDAKLRRDGKPTSVRLEFFQTDSVIGIAGRGYLGKGALKGRLTADTIEVFFPSTDEYLYEAVSDLMNSFDCTGQPPPISLFDLFRMLPDQALGKLDKANISIDRSSARYPRYEIRFADCPWQIELTYVRQKKGWRIKSFSFTDGDSTSLDGSRREYKRDAKVKLKKFAVPVKGSSARIIL